METGNQIRSPVGGRNFANSKLQSIMFRKVCRLANQNVIRFLLASELGNFTQCVVRGR